MRRAPEPNRLRGTNARFRVTTAGAAALADHAAPADRTRRSAGPAGPAAGPSPAAAGPAGRTRRTDPADPAGRSRPADPAAGSPRSTAAGTRRWTGWGR